MAVNTTVSISRSNGGDNTRTSYAGSMVMVAQFYIADASVAAATKVLNAASGQNLILPAGAVVLSVAITDAGTGHVDVGTLGYTSGTASTADIAANLDVSAISTTGIGATVTGTPVAELSYVTALINVDGAGTVGGYLTYFVVDPNSGMQVV